MSTDNRNIVSQINKYYVVYLTVTLLYLFSYLGSFRIHKNDLNEISKTHEELKKIVTRTESFIDQVFILHNLPFHQTEALHQSIQLLEYSISTKQENNLKRNENLLRLKQLFKYIADKSECNRSHKIESSKVSLAEWIHFSELIQSYFNYCKDFNTILNVNKLSTEYSELPMKVKSKIHGSNNAIVLILGDIHSILINVNYFDNVFNEKINHFALRLGYAKEEFYALSVSNLNDIIQTHDKTISNLWEESLADNNNIPFINIQVGEKDFRLYLVLISFVCLLIVMMYVDSIDSNIFEFNMTTEIAEFVPYMFTTNTTSGVAHWLRKSWSLFNVFILPIGVVSLNVLVNLKNNSFKTNSILEIVFLSVNIFFMYRWSKQIANKSK